MEQLIWHNQQLQQEIDKFRKQNNQLKTRSERDRKFIRVLQAKSRKSNAKVKQMKRNMQTRHILNQWLKTHFVAKSPGIGVQTINLHVSKMVRSGRQPWRAVPILQHDKRGRKRKPVHLSRSTHDTIGVFTQTGHCGTKSQMHDARDVQAAKVSTVLNCPDVGISIEVVESQHKTHNDVAEDVDTSIGSEISANVALVNKMGGQSGKGETEADSQINIKTRAGISRRTVLVKNELRKNTLNMTTPGLVMPDPYKEVMHGKGAGAPSEVNLVGKPNGADSSTSIDSNVGAKNHSEIDVALAAEANHLRNKKGGRFLYSKCSQWLPQASTARHPSHDDLSLHMEEGKHFSQGLQESGKAYTTSEHIQSNYGGDVQEQHPSGSVTVNTRSKRNNPDHVEGKKSNSGEEISSKSHASKNWGEVEKGREARSIRRGNVGKVLLERVKRTPNKNLRSHDLMVDESVPEGIIPCASKTITSLESNAKVKKSGLQVHTRGQRFNLHAKQESSNILSDVTKRYSKISKKRKTFKNTVPERLWDAGSSSCKKKEQVSQIDISFPNEFLILTKGKQNGTVKPKKSASFVKEPQRDIKTEVGGSGVKNRTSPRNLHHSEDGLGQMTHNLKVTDFEPQTSVLRKRVKKPLEGTGKECSYCGRTFMHEQGLQSHMTKMHIGKAVKICCVCGKICKTSTLCKVHMRVHTGDAPFHCASCGANFKDKTTYRRHQYVHTGETPFGCKVCMKRFRQRINLTVHMRTHTGEKPFQCQFCSRKFTQRAHLDSHTRVHSGEKPFNCKFCQRAFSKIDHLRSHELTHTGEKPHLCTFCGRGFADHSNMKVHERIHTGEKPYTCSQCGKAFTQSGSLHQHEKVHTGQKDYRCNTCGQVFSNSSNVMKHIHRYHSNK